jgi:serine/threonine protein kinase
MKPSPNPPPDESLLFNNCYQGKKKISAGSFGTVYSGVDIRNNESIAIKIEKVVGEEMRSVIREGTFLKKLEGVRGIPKVFWTGSKGDQDVLVITLLGKDLASFLKIYKKFSLKTVVMIADQLLTLLELIHAKNLLHRDIKPENILVGRGDQTDTIFYVDFGISKYYKDNLGRHIPFRDKKSFIGTTRYASIAAHLGNEISRKDDLESLAYVVIFLAKGILPWQNLNVSESEKTKKVGELKVKTPVEELCKGLPEEFAKYLIYVKNLTFKENPDYNYLKGLLLKVAMTHDITMDNQWDWVTPLKIENKIPNKKRNKNAENEKKSKDNKKKEQEEKMNIIIKKETMGKKKFSQDVNNSFNNISPMASPKGSYLKLGAPEDFMAAAAQLQLQVPADMVSNNNTSYASSYRGSSVCLKYEFTSKGYQDDIYDCSKFVFLFKKFFNEILL